MVLFAQSTSSLPLDSQAVGRVVVVTAMAMIDLSKSPTASPCVHTIDSDPGTLWSKESAVAIDAPPDSDPDPCPEAEWHREELRTGKCGVVSPRVLALPGGGFRMYYSQILPRPGFPDGANDYDNASTRILSAFSPDGTKWVPEPGVRLSPQEGGAGDFRVVSSEVVPVGDGRRLRMYFECCEGSQAVTNSIRSATSFDGLKWFMDPGKRVESEGHNYAAPRIIFLDDGHCRMYLFDRGKGIISLLSQDGLEFNQEPGLRIDQDGAFDTLCAFAPEIVRVAGVGYVMYYAGYSSTTNSQVCRADILRAVSSDGLTWNKDARPVISPEPGGWDAAKSSEMCLIRLPQEADEPAVYRMFYEACDGTAPNARGVWRIAAATSAFAAIIWCAVGMQLLASDSLTFETDILPIFRAKCVQCHGSEKKKAELSLESAIDLQSGGESGPVVVANKPSESLLFALVRSGKMPPKGNPALSPVEIGQLESWISHGAKHIGRAESTPAVTDRQIVPIMLLRCSPCHGGRRREAELDLRSRDSIVRGGKTGSAVVVGQPDESLIVKRIHAEEMPPRRQLVSASVKPMESAELELLKRWIAEGLPVHSDSSTSEPERAAIETDRQHWSFQPLRAPKRELARNIAQVNGSIGTDSAYNAVDEYVLAKLSDAGVTFSSEANKETLVRRVSFDLLGLPPEPEMVQEFVSDVRPEAYERLVDRLLASPRYGERWGRHWLDTAGYADSEGSQNEDRVRPDMWRYRDYVVRSCNSDKSYDRFLHEQIAGDELSDYERAETITDEIYDNLVATGFLRTAPDRTFANITNFVPDRLEVIADEIQILGSSVMGLTIHCARCHSHKFDPISQAEYYSLAALLKDALDEHDWLGSDKRNLTFVTSSERSAWLKSNQEIEARLKPLKEQLKSESDEAAKKELEEQIKELEAKRKPEPKIRALWSRGDPTPTYVLKRGNYLTPGQEVGAGVPSVLSHENALPKIQPPWPDAKTTGRRLALARWLTQENHPLTARVLVNRVWRQHFGAGIVTTLANFGKTGAKPSHPELLDWLATELVRNSWSLKWLHRTMVTSRTYRQSSLVSQRLIDLDRDNRLLSRMPVRRLEAESVRDSILSVSGQLDFTPFGPADEIYERGDGLVTSKNFANGGRRSIYVLHRRTKMPTILESFDSPQMGPNCVERGQSIVAPQALHLLNNSDVYALAKHFADRVLRESSPGKKDWLVCAHKLAFGRSPDRENLSIAQSSFDRLVLQWETELSGEMRSKAPERALHSYCHALLNSAEFLYVD